MTHRVRLAVVLLLVCVGGTSTSSSNDRMSGTCHTIEGYSDLDTERLLAFCTTSVPFELRVIKASARDSSIWIHVDARRAEQLAANRDATVKLVRHWMKTWRRLSGSTIATVHIVADTVAVVTGETLALGGDKVTIGDDYIHVIRTY